MSVTVHSLVRNEDKFIRYALRSVLPQVDKLLVFDTGSTDKTVRIIQSIKSDKIIFEEKGQVSPKKLVELRQEMIDRTKTDYFMLLDGDEIWPERNLKKFLEDLKTMPRGKVALYCRTRNCVGDIYHYLPESAGAYEFQGRRGHFTMRGFCRQDVSITGIYPLETYCYQNQPLNDRDEKLFFSDTWYLHATHLDRSSSSERVLGFRKSKIETGIAFKPEELPEVFSNENLPRRSRLFEVMATVITPLKELRRKNA